MPSGFDNNIAFFKGADTRNTSITQAVTNQMDDGELLIGRTVADVNGSFITAAPLTAGAGITITNGPGSITIAAAGGATAVDSFAMQTGTSPVVPDGSGLVTFNGSSVAAGTNPVRTNGTAANTMQLEVQISQALAGADATKIGLSNFDSSDFSVDANGFVTLASTAVPQTLTPDVGAAVSPVANDIDIKGSPGASFPTDSMLTHNYAAGVMAIENRRWFTAFVVDPSSTIGVRGTYTTLQAAHDAASAGDVVYVRNGTYTENVTITKDITFTTFSEGFRTSNHYGAIVIGKWTINTNGVDCLINGFKLQTNSDYILSTTGTSTQIHINNCFLNVTNNNGILINGASTSNVYLNNNAVNVADTFNLFTATAGLVWINQCFLEPTGSSPANSTVAADSIVIKDSRCTIPFSTSSTGAFFGINTVLGATITAFTNYTYLTTAGTGTSQLFNCEVYSGTASCLSAGAGTTIEMYGGVVNSSNTNAITGAGTFKYSNVVFSGSSTTNNATTQTTLYDDLGKYRARGQPAFLAYNDTLRTNVTGAGAAYTLGTSALTEVFDQDSNFNTNGTFTAPVTGRYLLTIATKVEGNTIAQTGALALITSNRTYRNVFGRPANSNSIGNIITVVADMDINDTATATITVSGEAGDTSDVSGSATLETFMTGCLLA